MILPEILLFARPDYIERGTPEQKRRAEECLFPKLLYRIEIIDQQGVEKFCRMKPDAKALLHQAVNRFHISMRTYTRIRKVARTIADLAGHDESDLQDISQAIQFRNVDGRYWR